MTDLRKAAEMALEAMVSFSTGTNKMFDGEFAEEISSLRQALNVDAVNMTQERVDETAKRKHEPEWIDDDFGTMWQKCGKKDCGKFVVRIGKADCWNGDCPEKEPKRELVGQEKQETRVFDRGCWERGCIAYDDRDGDGVVIQVNIKEKNT